MTEIDKKRITILKRIADYELSDDPKAAIKRLVELWREAHPEAVNETSSFPKPLIRTEPYFKQFPDDPDEEWFNDTYHVTVRRGWPDTVFGSREGITILGISSFDGTARHDWRDFQAIKNQLAGPQCEGFELYPAESRLLDPSNYYSLWCFPGVRRLRVGQPKRFVLDADEAMAPQRAFQKSDETLTNKEKAAQETAGR